MIWVKTSIFVLMLLSVNVITRAQDAFGGECANLSANTQKEISRLLSLGQPNPAPGKKFQIHSTVNEFLNTAPILDPNTPNFHAGNASFWQENIMKGFMVTSNMTSSDFQILGKVFIGKDDMLMRSSVNMSKIINELKSLGPQNKHDHFVIDYILLVLSDHAKYNNILNNIYESCEKTSSPIAKERKNAASNLVLEANKLKSLAYRPKFSLRDTPRILAIANATTKIAKRALQAK